MLRRHFAHSHFVDVPWPIRNHAGVFYRKIISATFVSHPGQKEVEVIYVDPITDLSTLNESITTKRRASLRTLLAEHKPQLVLSENEEFTGGTTPTWLLELHLDEDPAHRGDQTRRREVRVEDDTNGMNFREQIQAQANSKTPHIPVRQGTQRDEHGQIAP